MTEHVVETLDYYQVSYAASVAIIGVVASEISSKHSIDLSSLALNYTSFHKKRKVIREKKALKKKKHLEKRF